MRPEPPQWLLLSLISIVLLHVLLPVARVVPRECFWPCAALALLGLGLAQMASVQMRRAGTPMEFSAVPATLLSDGCFRYTRNPMYLGMASVLAGLTLAVGSTTGVLVTAGFCAYLSRFQIVPEERRLLEAFGEPYARYLREVRRWI